MAEGYDLRRTQTSRRILVPPLFPCRHTVVEHFENVSPQHLHPLPLHWIVRRVEQENRDQLSIRVALTLTVRWSGRSLGLVPYFRLADPGLELGDPQHRQLTGRAQSQGGHGEPQGHIPWMFACNQTRDHFGPWLRVEDSINSQGEIYTEADGYICI